MKFIIGAGVLAVIFFGGLIVYFSSQGGRPVTDTASEQTVEKELSEGEAKMADKPQAESPKAEEAGAQPQASGGQPDQMTKPASEIVTSGVYLEYSQAALAAANTRGDKTVLFFHAPWCPFCRSADAEFSNNLDKLPAGVTLLKTSYDQEQALKAKYGVTYQHTFVQIDPAGNLVTKWNGGALQALTTNLK